MTERGKDFEQAHLDQQIEQPARYLDAQANDLVEDLRRMYRPDNPPLQADIESLQRVQDLLKARFQPANQENRVSEWHTHHEKKSMHIGTTGMIDDEHIEMIGLMNSERRRQTGKISQGKSGGRRFARAFNAIAAVIIIVLLLGSATVLLTLKKGMPQSNTTTGNSSRVATTTPSPKRDCSRVLSSDLSSDNGEHTVCLQGLETPLNQSKTLNNHTITLIAAYADANRLLVKYTITGNDVNAYVYSGVPSLSRLTVQSGILNGPYTWLFGGGVYYDQSKDQTIFLGSFPTRTVPANTTQLYARADFTAAVDASSNDPAGTTHSQASFSFTIPFHTEKRVATPDQSTVINGHHVTLTQVVVTASVAYLFVKTDTLPLTSEPVTVYPSATLNGSSNVEVAYTTDGNLNGKWDPVTGFSVVSPVDWLTQTATWTLSLEFSGVPLGTGHGSIQFTVPL